MSLTDWSLSTPLSASSYWPAGSAVTGTSKERNIPQLCAALGGCHESESLRRRHYGAQHEIAGIRLSVRAGSRYAQFARKASAPVVRDGFPRGRDRGGELVMRSTTSSRLRFAAVGFERQCCRRVFFRRRVDVAGRPLVLADHVLEFPAAATRDRIAEFSTVSHDAPTTKITAASPAAN